MRVIGIRALPRGLTFAIIDTDSNGDRRVVNVESIHAPTALPWPEALKYLRSNVLDVLSEYRVSRAGLRIAENIAQGLSIPRIQVEAVLQESFSSSDLEGFYVGQIATIARRAGIERTDFKKYVDGETEFTSVEGWQELGKEEREAVLTALGAANA